MGRHGRGPACVPGQSAVCAIWGGRSGRIHEDPLYICPIYLRSGICRNAGTHRLHNDICFRKFFNLFSGLYQIVCMYRPPPLPYLRSPEPVTKPRGRCGNRVCGAYKAFVIGTLRTLRPICTPRRTAQTSARLCTQSANLGTKARLRILKSSGIAGGGVVCSGPTCFGNGP